MLKIEPSHDLAYNLAMATGQDAGNRAMKTAGRTAWDEEDWNAACAAFERVIGRACSRADARRQASHTMTACQYRK